MTVDYHKEMVKRSLISTGNNHRMKKAIDKARNGENTTIVYLGGSITMRKKELADRGYADASFRFFKENFAPDGRLTYINSGMNGTSSLIGLIRLERDVERYHPDIVFIEFSVNDSKDSLSREIFESMVVRLLESESRPAIVLLFLQSEGGYSCQGHMQVIGEHYKLPMISVCDAIQEEIEAGRMKWSEYANDNIHPHARGNDLVALFISNYYKVVDKEAEDEEEEIPCKPFYGTAYKDMRLLDSSKFKPLTTGGFISFDTISDFPKGWIRDTHRENTSFLLKLWFKHLFIIYKETGSLNEGSIILSVDSDHVGTFSGYRTFGWNNPTAKHVFSDEAGQEHLVDIRMAKGDEAKEFSLLALGYC
ncbi:MAG: SGNH/GDSL hydrolase family protein [Clostridiales bacterium]|jgi:lysophospholipase L1-like esterase|nr:SGNH/GDSL hydrolase family protein [Clostridiales bacterium]